ncbi:MFS transporter [Streptomyces sp. NRRL F-5755]|uniref:MFS transporter n=1 Tax=Streptomyces sp. NRRL F-5755 TaxID=1519475 RepID=UPI00099BD48A|nr:MFS transporter [Streptomyces sp. NRRL F-5755]
MSITTAASANGQHLSSRTSLMGWLAVVSVMMGIFAIVTSEILPIGLLTSIGSDFTVSDGMAGLMMTMPGFLAAAAAPLVTAATARFDRRLMLCVFMLLLALANFLAAAAPDYWLVLISRVMAGITIGGFWPISVGLAGRLVPPAFVDRATAVIFSAVPLGSILGVPAGTLIGHFAGWRTALNVMGVLAAGVLVMLFAFIPPLPSIQSTRLGVLGSALRSASTRFALLLTFLIVLAHFATYTYVTPFLEQVTHVSDGLITTFLLLYGAAGILGNFLGGAWVARYPRSVFGLAAGLIAAATLLFPVLGRWNAGAVVLLIVWGIAYGAVPVASQTWFSKAAPHTPEAASVLFTSSFQATISTGALAGGIILDRTSPSTLMLLGGCTAVLMLLVVGARFAECLTGPYRTEQRRTRE